MRRTSPSAWDDDSTRSVAKAALWWLPWLATVSLALVALAAGLAYSMLAVTSADPATLGWDRGVLLDAVSRWLSGSSPYPAFQIAGTFTAGSLSVPTVLYPPPALLLFAPFLVMPAWAWWALPLGVVAAVVVAARPSPLAVALIGVVLCLPATRDLLAWGNASMLFAALSVAPLTGPWVLAKPTLFPFALRGAPSRAWLLGLALLALASIVTLPLWGDYLASIRHATNSALLYSLPQYPFMAIPWLARIPGGHWTLAGLASV